MRNTGRLEEFQKGFGLNSVESLLKNTYGEASAVRLTQRDEEVVTELYLTTRYLPAHAL